MSGEYDYGDIFYPGPNADGSAATFPVYPDITLAFFIVFFILLSIILINLLLALSVKVSQSHEKVAFLARMSLRLKFLLDVEELVNVNLNGASRILMKTKILRILMKIGIPVTEFLLPTNVHEKVNIEGFSGTKKHRLLKWKHTVVNDTELMEQKMKDVEEELIAMSSKVSSIGKVSCYYLIIFFKINFVLYS